MREIFIKRADETPDVVNEFLHMVGGTSLEFCWPMKDPGIDLSWRVHGWKHVTYDAVLDYWTDYCSGVEPAIVRSEALGEIDEVRQLFLAAARRDPEAVGIIWSQFPNVQDHNEVFEQIYSPDERPRGIPHPSELAADLVNTIFSVPGSQEANLARIALLKLISVSVASGSRARKGRPKTRIPASTLRLLWKMSYCLTKQVHELDDFLSRNGYGKTRDSCLLEAYPWIQRIAGNMPNFLSYEPSKSALTIVSSLTGVSASFLEKTGLRIQS
jgi:hypothetical protein